MDTYGYLAGLHMPSQIAIRVVVDDPLRDRLRALAAAESRTVSSYVRIIINRHLIALDRQLAQQQVEALTLQAFYQNL